MPQRKTTTRFIISGTSLFSAIEIWKLFKLQLYKYNPYMVYVTNLVQDCKYVISHGMYCTLRSSQNTFCLSNSHKIRSFIAKCNSTNIY